jgi:DNA-binding NarL/FixJ family response regulator
VLDDGRSTNGTYVNEERVQNRRKLRHLDVIRVGATRLRFHDPSEASDTKLTEVASDLAVPVLTPAQQRVLVALCRPADGPASNEEIADELTVSIDTVKTHMRALFDAFHLQASAPYRKRFELVRIAVESGLVPPPERR